MLLRVLFSCWRTTSSRRNILFVLMLMVTICVLVHEWQWQNDSARRLEKITLTLTGPILPVKLAEPERALPDFDIASLIKIANLDNNLASLNSIENPESNIVSLVNNSNPDFYLNIRKLNVFAVHEMNKIIKSSEVYSSQCVKWWSNPLTASVKNLTQTEEYSEYNLSFVVHPGNFSFDVEIRRRKPPLEPTLKDLEIISPFKSTPSLPNQYCIGKEASEELKSVCQCGSDGDDITALESDTLKERIKWNATDPELITWRLHKSFSVEDYLDFTDYGTYIHSPGRTNYDIRTSYCLPSTKLLIMVSSAPSHFLHRKVIRNTYGNPENLKDKGVSLVFMMGKQDRSDYQKDLEAEIANYNDIIVETFVDSYHNLTLSHLSMYKWIYLTCTQIELEMPTHVLKADDDFFINVDLALRLVQEVPDVEYMGCLYCGTPAVRDLNYMYKYYTPRYMYGATTYVGYLSGVTYIFKTDIIPRVLQMSLTTPIIHMDDAYMTGLIPRQLNIYPHNSPLITYVRVDPDPCLLKKTISSCGISVEDMLLQWEAFKAPTTNCSLDYIDFHLQDLDEKQKSDCYFNTV